MRFRPGTPSSLDVLCAAVTNDASRDCELHLLPQDAWLVSAPVLPFHKASSRVGVMGTWAAMKNV